MTLHPQTEAVKAIIEAKRGATGGGLTLPGAKGVTLYKVMGKMFAILNTHHLQSVNLKCDPHLVDVLKQQYAGVGHRGHLDRRFWICVTLDSDVPPREVERLIGHSYDLVRASLTKKQKAELEALEA